MEIILRLFYIKQKRYAGVISEAKGHEKSIFAASKSFQQILLASELHSAIENKIEFFFSPWLNPDKDVEPPQWVSLHFYD